MHLLLSYPSFFLRNSKENPPPKVTTIWLLAQCIYAVYRDEDVIGFKNPGGKFLL